MAVPGKVKLPAAIVWVVMVLIPCTEFAFGVLMKEASERKFAFGAACPKPIKPAQNAGTGTFGGQRGRDSGGNHSGFAGCGEGTADDDAGGAAGGCVGGNAVSVLPQQERPAAGCVAAAFRSRAGSGGDRLPGTAWKDPGGDVDGADPCVSCGQDAGRKDERSVVRGGRRRGGSQAGEGIGGAGRQGDRRDAGYVERTAEQGSAARSV